MRAVIFANGELNTDLEQILSIIEPNDMLIAADGGIKHLESLHLRPHMIIGDLDSIQANLLVEMKQAGVEILQYAMDKDETDLELAVLHAIKLGATEIIFFGLLGGRVDMTVANLLLLAHPMLADIKYHAIENRKEIYVIRGGQSKIIMGQPGDSVSVFPLSGDAVGLTYDGLAYPLQKATLPFATPRGVSNLMVQNTATITLEDGTLLVIVHHLPLNE